MQSRVEVYSRQGCHLCDDAIAVVADVCDPLGVAYDVIDVDADPHLKATFGDDVPVVHVDGRTVGFWRVKADVLRAALAV